MFTLHARNVKLMPVYAIRKDSFNTTVVWCCIHGEHYNLIDTVSHAK